MDPKQIKLLNSELAASAQQDVRDRGLQKLQKLLIQEGKWFSQEDKELKMIWEGLFFMFWHSDKAAYQRDVAIKISKLLPQLAKQGKEKQKKWFESFTYIFNMHWDKVDNYRIDKYLLFLRYQFNEVLAFLKEQEYLADDLAWYNQTIKNLFVEEFTTSKGIPLQICDVFLEELNSVDSDISTETLSCLLDPFLYSLSKCRNRVLLNRIKERIFIPLLENNITLPDEEEDDEQIEELVKEEEQKRKEGKWIDGGKYSKRRQKEIEKLVNRKYKFPNFNILLFAQEYLLKYASDQETREENRNDLYDLYDVAQNLEPKPAKPELTFTQRMLVNRAQTFITKKMQKRMKFAQQKKNKKVLYQVGNLISSSLFGGDSNDPLMGNNIFDQIRQRRQYIEELNKEFISENNDTQNEKEEVNINSNGNIENYQNGGQHKEEQKESQQQFLQEETLNIEVGLKKKNKNKRKKRNSEKNNNGDMSLESSKKKVKFDLDHCQTREFFMHGKVATKKVDESCKKVSPSRGVIKQQIHLYGKE